MKSVILILLFGLHLLAKPIMVQYYQEIKNSKITPKNLLSYKLLIKHKQWIAKEMQYQDSKIISPYIKKQYMQIVQEMGDGKEIVVLKLFKNKKNLPLICMTKNLFSAKSVANSKLSCFIKEKKQWHKRDLIPKDDVSIFLSDSMSIKDLKIIKNIGINLFYSISNDKDTIIVRKAINSKEIELICKEDSSIEVDNRDDYLYYCKNLKGKLKPTFQYELDSSSLKFIKKPFKYIKKKDPLNDLYKKIELKRGELLQRYYHE